MISCQLEMSLDQEIPVLMKKTQMNGDSGAGSQCGLTSLLPMSCRGRAAAFARDLHSRLRNLGNPHEHEHGEAEGESSWLAGKKIRPASSTQIDTFYDFELECASPCSPIGECDAPFPPQSPSVDQFFDVDSDVEIATEQIKVPETNEKTKNGFRFSTAFYTDYSPVKLQPTPRENGYADKKLYSPITFEGCARTNSCDEIDSIAKLPTPPDTDQVDLPIPSHVLTLDSDSEFESAKSDPSECIDEVYLREENLKNDLTEITDIISLAEVDLEDEDGEIKEVKENDTVDSNHRIVEPLEIITTSEVEEAKETSPSPELEPSLLNAESNVDDEEDDRPLRVRRCSSLKTGKTPPGTPGRKKIVRFADVLGLDLADVKTFMDEIPVIPKSAYDDLTGCDVASSPPTRAPPRLSTLTLVPLFQLPRDVTEKLEAQSVCLESARVCDGVHVTICGSVRVRNLDFNKTVHVRYTMNSWKTYTDLQATYVQGSCDGYSDRFQFILYTPCISSGQRLELAVRFQCKGQQCWDNNNGANYCFDCLALGAAGPIYNSSGPLHPTMDWHPSFY